MPWASATFIRQPSSVQRTPFVFTFFLQRQPSVATVTASTGTSACQGRSD
jgi:hypothetical protein